MIDSRNIYRCRRQRLIHLVLDHYQYSGPYRLIQSIQYVRTWGADWLGVVYFLFRKTWNRVMFIYSCHYLGNMSFSLKHVNSHSRPQMRIILYSTRFAQEKYALKHWEIHIVHFIQHLNLVAIFMSICAGLSIWKLKSYFLSLDTFVWQYYLK